MKAELEVRTGQLEVKYFTPKKNEFSGFFSGQMFYRRQTARDWDVKDLNLQHMLARLFDSGRVDSVMVETIPEVRVTLLPGYDWSSLVIDGNATIEQVAKEATSRYFATKGF